jgi:hypothetical protein
MNSCSSSTSTMLPSAGERVLPEVHRPLARLVGGTHTTRVAAGPVGVLACGEGPASGSHTAANPLLVYHPAFAHQ